MKSVIVSLKFFNSVSIINLEIKEQEAQKCIPDKILNNNNKETINERGIQLQKIIFFSLSALLDRILWLFHRRS